LNTVKTFTALFTIALTYCASASAREAVENCGSLDAGVGPFDYRTATAKQRHIVESAHFTRNVENLVRGETSVRIASDLNYTLHAFPNHPRALMAMVNLGIRERSSRPEGAAYSVDCYFERAIRFRQDDGAVRMVFGYYLLRKGEAGDAIRELQNAAELSGEDMNVHYNIGLAYYDLKEYDKALEHAKRAYALGHPLPGLRRKLQRIGKWQP
jgi:tetratricopeptide (TPR) repeat protein